MSAKIVKIVRHCEVEAWVSVGWVDTGDLKGTHHGYHATLLEWPKPDEAPAIPSAAMEKPCA